MGENFSVIPEDILCRIFDQLEEQHLEVLALVSKQFLSITNPRKTHLKIVKGTLTSVPNILKRFQHLESITICTEIQGSYADLFRQISYSGSHQKGRENLKRLNFENTLGDKDFIAIADLFPWLEEISFSTTTSCSVKFTALKKVTFWNENFLNSDEAISSFTLNCVNLEEIDIKCLGVSEETIGAIIRNNPKLTTLKIPFGMKRTNPNSSLSIENSISCAKNLHSVSFSGIGRKEVVSSIVKANSLQSLKVDFRHAKFDGDVEISNLPGLIRTCSSIQDLSLRDNLQTDVSFAIISQHLTKLTHADFSWCSGLTSESFFILTKHCSFLEEIKFVGTAFGIREVSSKYTHKHEKIRLLDLSHNKCLDDKTLENTLLMCPNLQSIAVTNCPRLTNKGVQGILKNCSLLTDLKINSLNNILNIFGKYFEGRTIGLKKLEAGDTKFNNKTLYEIGKKCIHLEFLSIEYCKGVTNVGVLEVARNCKKLRKMNLKGCRDLSNGFLGKMVRSSSSIKRIVLPHWFVPSQELKNLLWDNCCKICHLEEPDL